jgi:hypothetical protein
MDHGRELGRYNRAGLIYQDQVVDPLGVQRPDRNAAGHRRRPARHPGGLGDLQRHGEFLAGQGRQGRQGQHGQKGREASGVHRVSSVSGTGQ